MLKVIKCPSCAAPLECDGDAFEKCAFCGSQVAVAQNTLFSENSSGFDGALHQAHKLKEVLRLVRGGNKIYAIKLYREIFNVSLKDAKDAVDRLEAGKSVNFQNVQIQGFDSIKINSEAVIKTGKTVGIVTAIFVGLGLLGALAGVGVVIYSIYRSANRTSSFTSSTPTKATPVPMITAKPAYAREVSRFGGEGYFKDNRTVAVDGEGKIYSADYQGGRVQVFDKDGKFLTQWMVKDKDAVIFSLVANRKGTVFITQPGGKIMAYEGAGGKLLNEAKLDLTSALSTTLDGKIIAAGRNDILLIDESLKPISIFKNAAQNAGIENGFNYLAVNGFGEIFATVDGGKDICKFSADGKFVDRFKIKPTSVKDMAIDAKGRIFIAETSKIWVYQSDGNLVDSFDANQCFALAFNEQDELLMASRPFILKYAVNQ